MFCSFDSFPLLRRDLGPGIEEISENRLHPRCLSSTDTITSLITGVTRFSSRGTFPVFGPASLIAPLSSPQMPAVFDILLRLLRQIIMGSCGYAEDSVSTKTRLNQAWNTFSSEIFRNSSISCAGGLALTLAHSSRFPNVPDGVSVSLTKTVCALSVM